MVNFGEVRRAQLAESTLLTFTIVPLGSFQIFKGREWGAENNRKLPHLFISSKTVNLIPEFAVEDLLWAELQPWYLSLQWKTWPWENILTTTTMMMIVYCIIYIIISIIIIIIIIIIIVVYLCCLYCICIVNCYKMWKLTNNKIRIVSLRYIIWNIKKKYSPAGIRLLYSKFIISNK